MPQKYWVSSEDLSADSSIDSSVESVQEKKLDNGKGVDESQKSTESIGKSDNDEAVVPAMATSMSLANLQPQQHATLFYLSLIEGRCRTQAASRINSRLRPQDHLPEDHPEICDLAQHLFNEMKKELLKAGMIPEEFAGHSLPDLRRYLNSFDSLLNNIAAKQNQDISIQTNNFRITNGSTFLLSGESSPFTQNSKALIRHIPRVSNEIEMAYPEADPRILALLYSKDQISTDSRSVYKSQYNELHVLGRGGGGEVYRVFDKIDRAEYAVKKIIIKAKHLAKLLNEGRSLQSVLKEMQTLAKLHHPHVVRYYHSWVEFRPAVVETVDNDSLFDSQSALDESSEAATASKKPWQQSGPRQAQSVVSGMAGLSLGQIDNELLASLKNEAGYDSAAAREFVVFDETKPRSASQTRSAVITEISHSMALEKQENLKVPSSKADVDVDAVLYIKMAAYPLTLHDYLHHKNTKGGKSKSPELKHCFHVLPTTRILLSIVHGMQYIHRQGIIHRDLKPNNIFISILEPSEPVTSEFIDITDCSDCGHSKAVKPTHFCVHIGDFGLIHEVKNAALLQEIESPGAGPAPKESSSGSAWRKPGDSFVVGTPYYAPPKVHGVKETFCPKRDCYALGIIALELIYPFATSSERHQILEKLRAEGVLPAELAAHKMVDGIMGMLRTNIAERWDLNKVKEWLLELERGCLKDEKGNGYIGI